MNDAVVMVTDVDIEFVCVQCGLRALVANLESGMSLEVLNLTSPPTFNGDMETHRQEHHPDQEATERERRNLVARYKELLAKALRKSERRAATAQFN